MKNPSVDVFQKCKSAITSATQMIQYPFRGIGGVGVLLEGLLMCVLDS